MKQAMSPEEIKTQKPYLDWSLSEDEYNYISEKLLGRLPNYTETGLLPEPKCPGTAGPW